VVFATCDFIFMFGHMCALCEVRVVSIANGHVGKRLLESQLATVYPGYLSIGGLLILHVFVGAVVMSRM